MIYKAVDYWNSPSLEHHGVKGMRWGVRKAIERTGRVVRRAGGAVKKSATTIAGGLYRAGSAVRRFKNRRAIKSGDANRILKRTKKMTNQELQDALIRVQLVNSIGGNHQENVNSLGNVVSNSLKQKAGQMAANALQTSVDSILRGETPLTGLSRNAEAQKQLQLQQISSNKLNTKTNNYKLINAGLQNTMDVSAMKAQTAKNNLSMAKDRRELSKVRRPKGVVSRSAGSVLNRIGTRSVSSLPPTSQIKTKLHNNSAYTTPIVDVDKVERQRRSTGYIYRHLRHDDFLAHYGVKGMKWGVRKAIKTLTNKHDRRDYKMSLMYGPSVNDYDRLTSRRNLKNFTKKKKYTENLLLYRDSNRLRYADKTNLASALWRRVTLGEIKSRNYNKLMASGHGKLQSKYLMNKKVSDISEEELGKARLELHEELIKDGAIGPDTGFSTGDYHRRYIEALNKGINVRYQGDPGGLTAEELWDKKHDKWLTRNKYITVSHEDKDN